MTDDEMIALLDRTEQRLRRAWHANLFVMACCTLSALITAWALYSKGQLRNELRAERDRNPCTLVASSMGGVELYLRQAPDDLTRLRVAGAAAIMLHPVIMTCTGTDASALAQRFTEGRTLDEQLAALAEMRALVQP